MPAAASSFYNRHQETQVLQQTLSSRRAELFILYGRRGVGKTALLERVLSQAGTPCIFYRATRRTLPLQLEALTEAVREAYPDAFLAQPFASLQVFLEFMAHQASQRPRGTVALVIDELPYLADVEPGLLTLLQHWWDAHKRQPNLKVFLAGSYLSFMERQVLDHHAPLYNRRTGALRLEPLDYAEAALFFPGYSPREKMEVYAILGGMPSYLEQFDPQQDIAANVQATILRRNTYLSEEPDWLLLEELRRDVTYGSILRAVANGARRPSAIAQAIGKQSAQDVAPQLVTLQDLWLLVRQVPITERQQPRSRTSLYLVADPYLDFWHRFVDPARSLVARGLGARLWAQRIAPALAEYVSHPTFERACRQYLWRALAAGNLPAELEWTAVGTWWGAGDRELDVVATDQRHRVILAGSCKWTNAKVDVREYAALQADLAQSGLATAEQGPWLALFSRAGFTPRLRQLAQAQQPQRVLLVDLAQMYQV
jgi:AAA+ ATPase superfamily predicted ATPase